MNKMLQLLSALSLMIIASCNFENSNEVRGNGKISSEERSVSEADRIRAMGGMDIIIDSGAPSVKIEADENVLKYIVTEERDGWLVIRTEDRTNLNTSTAIKVYVTTPNVRSIQIDGSGDVTANKKIYANTPMSFGIGGSGDIRLDVNAPEVESKIAGSGDINLTGETKNVSVKIAGHGDYKGAGLKAEDADVSIAGSGDVEVFADANLKVSITGSGSVKYKGNAKVDKSIMGSGSVDPMQ